MLVSPVTAQKRKKKNVSLQVKLTLPQIYQETKRICNSSDICCLIDRCSGRNVTSLFYWFEGQVVKLA